MAEKHAMRLENNTKSRCMFEVLKLLLVMEEEICNKIKIKGEIFKGKLEYRKLWHEEDFFYHYMLYERGRLQEKRIKI